MATPKDQYRTAAFRAWLEYVGGFDRAHAITGIAIRSLERMRSGKQPPPVRWLESIAADVDDPDLAKLLRTAAIGGTNA